MKRFLVVIAAASVLFAALPGSLAAGPQELSSSQQAPLAAPKQKRYSHANDFLMRGTVFNEKTLALPGAELRIRRISEKKFRWETMTNSRGEFAVRVPQGANYELVLRAKGFAEQKKTVDARSGGNEERMVFRMELPANGKSKEKK
jgi:curli biogenesis system outer membrane secretion channel CsgG